MPPTITSAERNAMGAATLQLVLHFPPPEADGLDDLAPVGIAEARINAQHREHAASAVRLTAVCSCGGPSERTEDGLRCVACAKVKS
jgi:hypothetical protein